MELIIDNRQKKIQIDADIINMLEEIVLACLKAEGQSLNCEVSVSFVDDDEIRLLNKEYRSMDKATDVLSFPMLEEHQVHLETLPILLGDIVISAETALQQSEEYGHTFKREIVYLAVHSMLHLLGYDHLEEQEKGVMREREKEIIKLIGIFKNNNDQGEGV